MWDGTVQAISYISGTIVAVVAAFNRERLKHLFKFGRAPSGALAVALDAIKAYEVRLTQNEQEMTRMNAVITSQSQQIALLKELVTSRADIAGLIHNIDQFHAHVLTRLELIDITLRIDPTIAREAAKSAALVLQTATDRAAELVAKTRAAEHQALGPLTDAAIRMQPDYDGHFE